MAKLGSSIKCCSFSRYVEEAPHVWCWQLAPRPSRVSAPAANPGSNAFQGLAGFLSAIRHPTTQGTNQEPQTLDDLSLCNRNDSKPT